jgi:4-amino-4-deoxy-L-arabinose transferase-like glycosyltransferase
VVEEEPTSGPPASNPADDARLWRLALLVVLGAAAFRLLLSVLVPLFPDETYYWEWSRRPAASYFDHPPGIAWLIGLGTSILGDTRAGIRLGPALAALVGSLALLFTARRIAGGRAALVTAAVLACMPLATAGLVVATPDAPLLAAFAIGLWAVVRAVEREPGSMSEIAWWCVAGLAVGAAMISKYTAVLLPAGVALGFALDPRLRRRLLSFGPWIGVGLGVAAFSPVIMWNARLGWPSFAFQARHGLEAKGVEPGVLSILFNALKNEAELLGGQLGLVSPILFLLIALAVLLALGEALAGRGDERRSVLAGVAITAFGVFALSALKRNVEANWPAPAYVAGVVVLATVSWTAVSRRWLRWGLALGGLIIGVIWLQAIVQVVPIDPYDDPIGDAHGWDTVAAATDEAADELRASGCPQVWVASNRYQETSELAFHLAGQPDVFSLNLWSRTNQYDLWPRFTERAEPGDCLLFVAPDGGSEALVAERIAPAFGSVEDLGMVERKRGSTGVGRTRIHALSDWTGDTAPFDNGYSQ